MSSRNKVSERERNEKIRQLREVTGVNEQQARQTLQSNDWAVDRAINAFFEESSSYSSTVSSHHSSYNSQSSSSRFDRKKIEQLWTVYADPREPNKMNLDQLLRFISDLQFDPSDREILVLCWKMNASKQGELQRTELLHGCQDLQCDTLEKLREKVKQLNHEIETDNEKFKQLYIYTFNFARSSTSMKNLDVQPGMKNLNDIVRHHKQRFINKRKMLTKHSECISSSNIKGHNFSLIHYIRNFKFNSFFKKEHLESFICLQRIFS